MSRFVDTIWADGPILFLLCIGLCIYVRTFKSSPKNISEKCVREEGFTARGNGKYRNLIAILVILLTAYFLCRDVLLTNEFIIYGDDLYRLHYMFEKYVQETLDSGKIPFWNPYVFSGSPALAHPQFQLFYPPQLFFRLLPLNLSFSWSIAFHIFLAGIGMYALSKIFSLEPSISLLTAITYMLNGGMTQRIYAGHLWLMYAISFFPLTFYFFVKAFDSNRPSINIGASFCLALLILTGHPAYPFYAVLFIGMYWFYRVYISWLNDHSWKKVLNSFAKLIIIFVIGISLCAIQLVPTLEMQKATSLTSGYSIADANFLSLTVSDLFGIFLPQFYINIEKQAYYWELIPYIGVVFIIFSILAYVSKNSSNAVWLLKIIPIISMLLAFGATLGFYIIFYLLFPPLKIVRVPPRSLFMWMPSIILLGGIGLQMFFNHMFTDQMQTTTRKILGVIVFFMMGVTVGYANLPNLDNVWNDVNGLTKIAIQSGLFFVCITLLMTLIKKLISIDLLSLKYLMVSVEIFILAILFRVLFFPDTFFPSSYLTENQTIKLFLRFILILTILLLIFVKYQKSMIPKSMVVIVLVLVQYADVGTAALRHIKIDSPPTFFDDERLLFRGVNFNKFDRVLASQNFNQYMLLNVSNINGFNSGILDGYQIYIESVSKGGGIGTTSLLSDRATVDSRALDFLGVRYMISPDILDDHHFKLISDNTQYFLYENPDVLPRVYMVYDVITVDSDEIAANVLLNPDFDYEKSVVLHNIDYSKTMNEGVYDLKNINYEPAYGSFDISVETSHEGILVFSEPYYSERKIRLDGETTTALRANIGFIAATVPPGKHRIELIYQPTSFYIGVSITFITLAICTVLVIYDLSHYKKSDDAMKVKRILWFKRKSY
ncbi:MAG: YfhO family protein [Bacteroidales bacterium]|nr:YfhO family protein [Bacteroidales bacterium]